MSLRGSQSGMWVIGRDVLDRISPRSDGMAFSEEIKIRTFKRCKCGKIPVQYKRRVGQSKISTALDGIGEFTSPAATKICALSRFVSMKREVEI